MDSSPLIIDINSAKGVIIKFAPRLNLKARQKNIIKKSNPHRKRCWIIDQLENQVSKTRSKFNLEVIGHFFVGPQQATNAYIKTNATSSLLISENQSQFQSNDLNA